MGESSGVALRGRSSERAKEGCPPPSAEVAAAGCVLTKSRGVRESGNPARSNVSTMLDSMDVEAMDVEVLEAPSEEALRLLAAVAEPLRWSVLRLLSQAPSCACNLQEHLPIAANLLSYHLKVLREAGLVTSTKRGRLVDYAIAPGAAQRLRAALPLDADTLR